jgi:hypothetical protein
MIKRKIVQISVSAGDDNNHDILYALDSEGMAWKLIVKHGSNWELITPLPEKLPSSLFPNARRNQ